MQLELRAKIQNNWANLTKQKKYLSHTQTFPDTFLTECIDYGLFWVEGPKKQKIITYHRTHCTLRKLAC